MSSLIIPRKIGVGTQVIACTVQNWARVFHTTGMVCTFELDLR